MGNNSKFANNVTVTAAAALYRTICDCIAPKNIAFEYRAINANGLQNQYTPKADVCSASADRLTIRINEEDIVDISNIPNGAVAMRPCTINGAAGAIMFSKETRLLPSEKESYDIPAGDWFMTALFDNTGTLLYAKSSASAEQIKASVEDLRYRDDNNNLEQNESTYDEQEELDYLESLNTKEV